MWLSSWAREWPFPQHTLSILMLFGLKWGMRTGRLFPPSAASPVPSWLISMSPVANTFTAEVINREKLFLKTTLLALFTATLQLSHVNKWTLRTALPSSKSNQIDDAKQQIRVHCKENKAEVYRVKMRVDTQQWWRCGARPIHWANRRAASVEERKREIKWKHIQLQSIVAEATGNGDQRDRHYH